MDERNGSRGMPDDRFMPDGESRKAGMMLADEWCEDLTAQSIQIEDADVEDLGERIAHLLSAAYARGVEDASIAVEEALDRDGDHDTTDGFLLAIEAIQALSIGHKSAPRVTTEEKR